MRISWSDDGHEVMAVRHVVSRIPHRQVQAVAFLRLLQKNWPGPLPFNIKMHVKPNGKKEAH